jgi:hypothetical protein
LKTVLSPTLDLQPSGRTNETVTSDVTLLLT